MSDLGWMLGLNIEDAIVSTYWGLLMGVCMTPQCKICALCEFSRKPSQHIEAVTLPCTCFEHLTSGSCKFMTFMATLQGHAVDLPQSMEEGKPGSILGRLDHLYYVAIGNCRDLINICRTAGACCGLAAERGGRQAGKH